MTELLPAIDLRGGQVVRLTKGDDARRTVYEDDPTLVLDRYRETGVRRAHVVDLDAALGETPQLELLERLLDHAASTGGPKIQLGGGLRDRASVERALGLGCDRVVLGSLVTRDFRLFTELAREFPQRLVPALDVKDGKVRIAGWTEDAPDPLEDLCRRLGTLPCPAVLVTDIDRDGTLEGPNLELARRVGRLSGIPALLSGGVHALDDLRAARRAPEIGGVVVGKALYEGAFSLREAVDVLLTTHLAPRIIPCLDVKAGRVVKGVKFQNLVDQGDPAESALRYARQGADEIVFLDITAAPERRGTDLEWVRRAAEQVFVPLTVGGGVRSVDDARELLLAGADKVAVNSAAVADRDLLHALARRFGSQCVVLSVDGLRREDGSGWEVVTQGGRKRTGLDVLEWIDRGIELGAGEILLTSIDADGTKEGYDLELLRAVCSRVDVPVIASGGVGSPEHLAAGLEAGAAAVLAASIFHEGTHTVGEVKHLLSRNGFPMRLEKGRTM